jgi:hypothetical protein
MSHQIMITLSDDEYAALVETAKEKGQSVEEVASATLKHHYSIINLSPTPVTYDELLRQMYNDGEIINLPTGEIDEAEEAELDRIGRSIGPGKPASEMIIEDRGPY